MVRLAGGMTYSGVITGMGELLAARVPSHYFSPLVFPLSIDIYGIILVDGVFLDEWMNARRLLLSQVPCVFLLSLLCSTSSDAVSHDTINVQNLLSSHIPCLRPYERSWYRRCMMSRNDPGMVNVTLYRE